VSANQKPRSRAARAVDAEVLRPVPRIDAVYLRNASHIVEVRGIEGRVVKGTTSRGGFGMEIIVVEAMWRGGESS